MIKKSERSNAKNTIRVMTINDEPSRTQQQFKADVNVNNIMKRYRKTGQIVHLNNRKGIYADLTNVEGYFESLNKIALANQAFEQLPSEIRRRFQNDPKALLEFIHDPNNFDEGVKLGIFDSKQPSLGPSSAPKTKVQNPIPRDNDSNDDAAPTKKTK